MPDTEQQTPRSPPYYQMIFLAAALYVFIHNFDVLSPIILIFLLVVLISFALNPMISGIRHLIGDRTVATAIVIVAFLGIAGATAWAFYTPVKQSTSKFIQMLPQYWERVQRPLLKMQEKAAVSEERVKKEVRTEVVIEEAVRTDTAPQQPEAMEKPPAKEGVVQSGMSQLVGGLSSGFKSIAANTATLLMVAITTFFGVIFTLLNPRPMVTLFFTFIPEHLHEKSLRIAKLIIEMLPRWALATLLGMLTIGTLVFLALWPLLGFQDAVVLALIACVMEAVPFIGPMLAVVPAILLAVGKGGLMPLWVILVYAGIQLVENHLVYPVIVAGRLQLRPVAVVFSLLLSVTIFGVLGVLLAVPAVAIANILIDELYRPKFSPNTTDKDLDNIAKTALNNRFRQQRKAAEHAKEREEEDGKDK